MGCGGCQVSRGTGRFQLRLRGEWLCTERPDSPWRGGYGGAGFLEEATLEPG